MVGIKKRMRRRALQKDFLMEIKKSKNRFLSILAIVTLGVAFYTGTWATAPDMLDSGDAYFDHNQLMDIRVMGSMGLTESDVEVLSELDGIRKVEPGYMADVYWAGSDSAKVLRAEAILPTLNRLTALEGRLPQESGEIFLDVEFARDNGIEIGDVIELVEEEDWNVQAEEQADASKEEENGHVLKKHQYTLVGIGSSPLYISFVRGNTNVGNGEIAGNVYILPQDFDYDIYTQAYLQVEGSETLNAFDDAYDDLVARMIDAVEGIAPERCQVRYDEVMDEANAKLDNARQELADGKKEADEELAEAWQEILDAEKEIADAEAEIADAWIEISDNKELLMEKEAEIADAKAELADGEKELADGIAEFEENEAKFNEEYPDAIKQILEAEDAISKAGADLGVGWLEYDEGESQIRHAQIEIDEGRVGIEDGKRQLAEKWDEYYAAEALLAAKEQELLAGENAFSQQMAGIGSQIGLGESADADTVLAKLQEIKNLYEMMPEMPDNPQWQQLHAIWVLSGLESNYEFLKETYAELSDGRTQLNAAKEEMADGKMQLDAAQAQLNAMEAQLEEGQRQLDAQKPVLEDARRQLEEGQAAFDENAKKVQDARKELEDAQAALEEARLEIEDGKAELEDARQQIADGEKKIADGWKEIADAEAEIADAQKELADGKQELANGKTEYEDGKREAEEEIADAEQKIADAQKEIEEIEMAEWTVEDRNSLPEHAGYSDNAQRIANIAKVFPALFFLIAALICLTTMTRMVEEERTQIGTLQALGYSKAAIASKYIKYAVYATIGGSVLGILIGEKIIPYVIIDAYGIMYVHINEMMLPYQISHGLAATGLALLSTVGATWAACSRSLDATPAVLMRPPAPKEGKRVLLEYLPFIWNRLSFSWKSTIRNMMRYKKRVFMTVFGISGCMGLIITGYGISDSIMGIATLQYEQLQHYDVMLIGEDEFSDEEKDVLRTAMDESDDVENYASVLMQTLTVLDGKKEHTLYVIVPEDVEGFSEFMTFRDRNTHETWLLQDEGVIAAEKIMNLLHVGRNEYLPVEDEDGRLYQIPVTQICENYMSHFLYMTPDCYEEVFGKEPVYDEFMVQMPKMTEDRIEEVGERLLEYEGVLSVSYTRTVMGQLEHMLTALDAVILVLIISAGLLAFVVLYNLNNININERKREMATLKVLGFFDHEVSAYVYRENILLTLIGVVAGFLMGKIMHRFIIVTVEVDMCMFGRNIDPPSYLIAAGFTVLFSLIVNGVMHFKLKKIDMVESLKSVE